MRIFSEKTVTDQSIKVQIVKFNFKWPTLGNICSSSKLLYEKYLKYVYFTYIEDTLKIHCIYCKTKADDD